MSFLFSSCWIVLPGNWILYDGFPFSNFTLIGHFVHSLLSLGNNWHFVILSNKDDLPEDSVPITITFGNWYNLLVLSCSYILLILPKREFLDET